MPSRVLIVDDDRAIVRMLQRTLEAEGFEVAPPATAAPRWPGSSRGRPTWSCSTAMMPGLDGLAVARRLRAKGDAVPILMLTARDAVPDRVEGLEAGADDYLVKPFEPVELVARIRALLRRGQVARAVSHGDLQVDPDARLAVAGRPPHRAHRPRGRAAGAAGALGRAGGQPRRGAGRACGRDGPRPTGNAVDQHIAYAALASWARPPLIQTVRGVGFTVRR